MATSTLNLSDLPNWLDGIDPSKIDLRAVLRTVGLYLASQAKRNFDQGQSPDGVPWAPLVRPSRKRGGPTAKPLRDTGILMASMAAGADHVEDIDAASLTWGTNVWYAGFHQHGTRRIPARPFIGLTPQMEMRIAQIVIDGIAKQVKARAT